MPEIEQELSDFGRQINRYLPARVSLSRLSREADVDYTYLHALVKGRRGNTPLQPSVEIAGKVLRSLHEVGAEMTPEQDAEFLSVAARLPEGFTVQPEDDKYSRPREEVRRIIDDDELVERITDYATADSGEIVPAKLERLKRLLEFEINEDRYRKIVEPEPEEGQD